MSSGCLNRAVWTGATFRQTEHPEKAAREGGLLVDPGLHFVFFLSADGRPRCFRKDQGKWSSVQIGTEPVQLLLGIDEKAHRLFAYDAVARGIRTYTYHRKSDDWRSELIVTGLGPAGDAGVMDAARGTIYTSHETADDGIPRAEGVELMEDPTGTGLLKPWPLVATSWDGNGWSSRVLAETGVPQQPGLRLPDRSLFFTVRWDFESVRVLRMRPGADAGGPTIWNEAAGRETFADHPHYKIREPRYPPSLGGSMTVGNLLSEVPVPQIPLTPPIDIVPCFRPVWSEKRLDARITAFRAVVNPRQARLIQHRHVADGELVREQVGKELMGYLYRDAKGVLARSLSTPGLHFWELNARFDPEKAPEHFATLRQANGTFYTFDSWLAAPEHFASLRQANRTFYIFDSWLAENEMPLEYSIDGGAAFVPPHLSQPYLLRTKTFGHRYLAKTNNQKGGRFQRYTAEGTTLATRSAIAVDRRSGATFYTQAAPTTASRENLALDLPWPELPLFSVFRPKHGYSLKAPPRVWIVMVH